MAPTDTKRSTIMPQPSRSKSLRPKTEKCFASTLVIALLLQFGTACSTDRPTTTPVSSSKPREARVQPNTFVWSAEPGIDLQGRYGELTRAGLEAGSLYGSRPRDDAFPGYFKSRDQSTIPPLSEYDRWGRGMYGSDPELIAAAQHTKTYAHIADISVSGTRLTARTCQTSTAAPGHPRSDFPSLPGMAVPTEIVFNRKSAKSGLPGIRDTGQYVPTSRDTSVPSWDVFEGWVFEVVYWDRFLLPDGPEKDAHITRCENWLSDVRNQIKAIPKSGRYYPLGRQYPRWIGPQRPE